MKVSKLFESKYLKASDVPVKGVTCVIERFELIEVQRDGGKQTKGTLWLSANGKAVPKPLVVNKTNGATLTALGDDTDEWIGKEIVLKRDDNVMYMGRRVSGIRVDIPDVPEEPTVLDLSDDDIPF